MFIHSTGAKIPPPQLEVPTNNLEFSVIAGENYVYCAEVEADLLNWIRINASSVIFHREVFSNIGTFDETLLHVEAVEFFMRAFARFPLVIVKKCLASIRRHDQNRTLDIDRIDQYYILTTEKIAQHPDDYPVGTLESFRHVVNMRFLSKGRQAAKEKS